MYKFVWSALLLIGLLAACGGGTPDPTVTSVAVTADVSTVNAASPAVLTATVVGTGAFSNALTWSIVSGGGTLSATTGSSVTFTSPSLAASSTTVIAATSVADSSKTASITISSNAVAPPTITSVAVAADLTTVNAASPSVLTATVVGTGAFDPAVTWNIVSGGGTLSATTGSSITFTSPSDILASVTVIRATSVADPSKTASVTINTNSNTLGSTITGISVSATAPAVRTTSDLTATVVGTGNFDPAVRWRIFSSPALGSLNTDRGATVRYTAPTGGLGTVVRIEARSVQDSNVRTIFSVSVNSGRVSVSSGLGNHTLAVPANGAFLSWGSDSNGQLGNGGNNVDSGTPATVSVLPGGTNRAVSVGLKHSMALTSGTVYAWGKNNAGQLGLGNNTDQDSPDAVQGLSSDLIAIAAGANHSMALRPSGRVFCWGSDSAGQLGNGGANIDLNVPTAVNGLTDIIAIAAGEEFSLALKTDGTVYSWGSDAQGQLGNGGANTNTIEPGLVTGAVNVIAIAAGRSHALALKSDGTMLAWGIDNNGELGDNVAVANKNVPVAVADAADIIAISAGFFHSMALKANLTALVWGSHFDGQLGTGANGNQEQRTPIATTSGNWVGVAAAGRHSFGLKSDGTLVSFGSDSNGQLGNGGANTNLFTPDSVLLGAFLIQVP